MEKKIINVQWVENGTIKYENFLTDMFIEDFVKGLEDRGCTDIKVEEIEVDR